MLGFTLKNPVKILFGKGKIAAIKDEIPAGSRVLVTYGGGSVKKTEPCMQEIPGPYWNKGDVRRQRRCPWGRY